VMNLMGQVLARNDSLRALHGAVYSSRCAGLSMKGKASLEVTCLMGVIHSGGGGEEVVVDGRQPGGDGVAPQHGLHGGQPRERRGVRAHFHAHVRVDEDVQVELGGQVGEDLREQGKPLELVYTTVTLHRTSGKQRVHGLVVDKGHCPTVI
jgi:hypothetical protein